MTSGGMAFGVSFKGLLQQCLYFFPLLQGQGELRPIFAISNYITRGAELIELAGATRPCRARRGHDLVHAPTRAHLLPGSWLYGPCQAQHRFSTPAPLFIPYFDENEK